METRFTRREVLGLVGAGAAVLGASSLASSATKNEATPAQQEEQAMTPLEKFNKYGEDLEYHLMLRTSPIAAKMLVSESDIPVGAFRPKKERGYHFAQCQAFALSRRDGVTIAMLKEDHWCPAAPLAYGNVPPNQQSQDYDCFPYGKYVGIVTAPLKTASFIPDVVIIWSNNAQLRSLILSMDRKDSSQIKSCFLPPSCSYSVVNPIQDGNYWVVLPDPGEYERGLGTEDEMMFSAPGARMESLISGLRKGEKGYFAYRHHHPYIRPNFPRPDFYRQSFKSWGLDADDTLDWPEYK
ncbi:MAG: DUF169 domain-containing protein [Deltaproteobacteria bacterium]|nr:DUF169 domain-containing protein [Deltaproteobacteria bacterium]